MFSVPVVFVHLCSLLAVAFIYFLSCFDVPASRNYNQIGCVATGERWEQSNKNATIEKLINNCECSQITLVRFTFVFPPPLPCRSCGHTLQVFPAKYVSWIWDFSPVTGTTKHTQTNQKKTFLPMVKIHQVLHQPWCHIMACVLGRRVGSPSSTFLSRSKQHCMAPISASSLQPQRHCPFGSGRLGFVRSSGQ